MSDETLTSEQEEVAPNAEVKPGVVNFEDPLIRKQALDWAEQNVTPGLRSKTEELLGKLRDREAKLSEFEAMPLERLKKIQEALAGDDDDAMNADPVLRAKLESHTARLKERADAERAELETKLAEKDTVISQALEREHRRRLDDQTVEKFGELFEGAKSAKFAKDLAASHFEVDPETSAIVPKKAGYTWDDFRALLISDYSFLLKRSSGAGAVGSTGPTGGKKKSELTSGDRIRFIREHGEEAYRKLPA